MSHLSPAAIFSPSIARLQQATAKDWNYIDNWLSSKFPSKSPPPFERNPETLKALLALATLNSNLDEENDLLHKLELRTLSSLQTAEENNHNTPLLSTLEENLTKEGKVALETISELSISLNSPLPTASKLGGKILDLQTSSFNLEQTSERITILERHLNTELSTINELIQDFQSEAYQPPAELAKETLDYQRRVKGLSGKIPELRDKVRGLSVVGGREEERITIQDVREEEDKFRAMMKVVRDLETQVKSYHGLPQDTDLARLELESLRVELQELSRDRDAMFEGLVERESPKKTRS